MSGGPRRLEVWSDERNVVGQPAAAPELTPGEARTPVDLLPADAFAPAAEYRAQSCCRCLKRTDRFRAPRHERDHGARASNRAQLLPCSPRLAGACDAQPRDPPGGESRSLIGGRSREGPGRWGVPGLCPVFELLVVRRVAFGPWDAGFYLAAGAGAGACGSDALTRSPGGRLVLTISKVPPAVISTPRITARRA